MKKADSISRLILEIVSDWYKGNECLITKYYIRGCHYKRCDVVALYNKYKAEKTLNGKLQILREYKLAK